MFAQNAFDPPLSAGGRGEGGRTSNEIFKKGEWLDKTSTSTGGVAEKEGVTFLRRGEGGSRKTSRGGRVLKKGELGQFDD